MNEAGSARAIVVVTGSRAEFGLLRSVMAAIESHDGLTLRTIVAGCHLLGPDRTIEEVRAEFEVHATVPMQEPGHSGRPGDARALGRGVTGLVDTLDELAPDVVLVLGDRIEAFAAASAASVMGIRVAHMHGGDRAQGIADEALRHAITKLAHIHLPATETSAQRIIALGEPKQSVHLVGSPAIDDLNNLPMLDDDRFSELGTPEIVFLLHPIGGPVADEYGQASAILGSCTKSGRTLALDPNHDPGREGIRQAIEQADCPVLAHAPRPEFIGLLRRTRCIVGNSSAGLIECAALGTWCINLGQRQEGRERAANVIDVESPTPDSVERALAKVRVSPPPDHTHPYGDGRSGIRTAEILASFDPARHPVRKRITL